VPKAKKDDWALLGGGDVFFIVATAISFLKIGPVMALCIGGGMFGALIGLFIMSKKGRFYPAIPYLLVGAVVGALVAASAA
jgi:presenilin-like A22 family membrane protease